LLEIFKKQFFIINRIFGFVVMLMNFFVISLELKLNLDKLLRCLEKFETCGKLPESHATITPSWNVEVLIFLNTHNRKLVVLIFLNTHHRK
jgi:hypothetical protein